jgi:Ca2+-binding RTX toxin-like protein
MRRPILPIALSVAVVAGLLVAPTGPASAVVTCGGVPVTDSGTTGNDVIEGTPGPDVIHGLGGDDVIRGFGGDDLLCGGDGDDTLLAGAGADVVLAGSGADTVVGGPGPDDITGGAGGDDLRGGGGPDTIEPGAGPDAVDGGGGSDTATFTTANRPVRASLFSGDVRGQGGDTLIAVEHLEGSDLGDTLVGNAAANRLRGGDGDDTIFGAAGDDVLRGGSGVDDLYGGPGADECSGGETTDSCLLGLELTLVTTLPDDVPNAGAFSRTGLVTSRPGDDRLFVVDRIGYVWITDGGTLLASPFLDISGLVGLEESAEQGLLGLAFHPSGDGRFYVDYTNTNGDSVIAEYDTSNSDPDAADPASARVLLTVPQPARNHNAGMLEFAPDGTLLIGLGDGGGSGDPSENGQDTSTLLGAILRIDPDGAVPYAIPSGNPFVGGGGREEIWAYGLRNPWRFSVDHTTGRLYIGDVGQNAREEVDVLSLTDDAGANLGWNTVEGDVCYDPPSGCDQTGMTPPVLVYANPGEGCSVIGGYVYRGSVIPELHGRYLYGDFCSGFLRSFRFSGSAALEQTEWLTAIGKITSFGTDSGGEVYIALSDGTVHRIDPVR